jgi:toxin ParE1/3/4
VPRRRFDVSEHAQRGLAEAFDYTIDRWGIDQAYVYSEVLLSRIEQLAEFPEIGRDRSEIRNGLRSLIVEHHVILYRVFDDSVLISRVIHERMDMREVLADPDELFE